MTAGCKRRHKAAPEGNWRCYSAGLLSNVPGQRIADVVDQVLGDAGKGLT